MRRSRKKFPKKEKPSLIYQKQSGNQKLFAFNTYEKRDFKREDPNFLIDFIHFGFQQFEKGGKKAFWNTVIKTGFSRQEILDLVSAIAMGIRVNDNKVSNTRDSDAKIANRIISLTPNYGPIKTFRKKYTVTTLEEHFNNRD